MRSAGFAVFGPVILALAVPAAGPAAGDGLISALTRESARLAPVAQAPPCQSVLLDGEMEDAVWRLAPKQAIACAYPDGARRDSGATWQAAFDGSALFVAVTVPQPAPAFTPPKTGRDEYGGDLVELFLDAGGAGRPIQVCANPLGLRYDARAGDASWNGTWEAGGKSGPGGWTLEMRIPFADLGAAPGAPGRSWRANVCLSDRGRMTSWTTGWGTGNLGVLFLGDAAAYHSQVVSRLEVSTGRAWFSQQDRVAPIRIVSRVAARSPDSLRLRVRLRTGKGAERTEVAPLPGDASGGVRLNLRLAGVPMGRHAMQVELLAGSRVLAAGSTWLVRSEAPPASDGLVASVKAHPAGQEWNDRWFAWPHKDAGVQLDRYRYYPMEPLARAMLVAPVSGGELAAATVKLSILDRATGKPVRSASIKAPERCSTLDLHLAGLKAGSYTLRAAFAHEGRALGAFAAPFVIGGDEWTATPALRTVVPLVTDEPTDRPEAGQWPVTFGVPFPRNALFDPKHVRVVDGLGKEVPSASRVTATWYRGSKCVKWLLLDTQRPFGPRGRKSYRLEFGKKVRAGAPLASMVRSADANQVTVDTGALRFTIRKDRPSVVDAAWLGARQVVFPGEGSAAFWVDEKGTRYDAVRDGARALVVETDSPLRVEVLSEGRYVNRETGKELSRFVLRVAAFRGQPVLRVYHTLVWTTDGATRIAGGSLSFRTAGQPTAHTVRIGAGDKMLSHPLAGAERVFVVQDRWDHFSIGRQGPGGTATLSEGRQASGWMESNNGRTAVGLCQRFFWQQQPGGLEAGADRLLAHWYPPQAKALSFAARDVIADIWMKDPQYGEKSVLNYPQGFLNTEPQEIPDPFGLAKTHEVWLNFRPTAQPNHTPAPRTGAKAGIRSAAPGAFRDTRIVNDLVQRPAFMLASPRWMCATAIEGPMAARDDARWGAFEQACDLIFRNVTMAVPSYDAYHWINFGDVHQEFPGPYRHWACNGYDWPMVPWLQFMRTGKRMYLENGEANTRHFIDIDTCHADKRREIGFPKIAGGQYQYAGIHWTYGPLAEGHTMFIDHELWYYYLTGFRRSWDVAMLWADLKKRTHGAGGVPYYHGQAGEREATKPSDPILGMYEATWDTDFYDLGRRFYEMATGPQNAEGGFGPHGPGDSYADIMTYRTLSRMALYTGEPEHEARVVRWARGKGLDRFDRDAGWAIPPTEPVGLAAHYSKDPGFARYARYIAGVIARGAARTDDPFTVGSCSGQANMRWATFFRGLPAFVWALNRFPPAKVPELRNPALGLSAILSPPEEDRREGWGEMHLAYVKEATDRPLRLRVEFAAYQAESAFLIRIVDPDGKECLRRLDEKRNPSGAVDVPADGKAGTYRIECTIRDGNWNNGMRVTGDLPVVYAHSPTTHLCGWGPLYLLAKPDADEVSVDITLHAGQAKLWAPDGTLLASAAPTSNGVDPTSRSNAPLVAKIRPEWRGKEFRLDFGPAGFPYSYLRGLNGFEPFLAQAKGQAFVP